MAAVGPARSRLGPLRRRAFARFWLAAAISDVGDWLLLVGLPVYVLERTGSNLQTSIVFLVGLLPGLIAGPVGGVLVDRFDRRGLLVAVSLAQAALLLPLLGVGSGADLWIVFVVQGAQSALAALSDPARSAAVPELVGTAELVQAGGLIGLTGSVARLVGGPLGGLLVATTGLGGIVLGDAASFVLAALLLVRPAGAPVRRTSTPRSQGVGLLPDLVDGIRLLGGESRLRWALAVAALNAIAQGIFVVLFVAFVLDVLHGDGGEVGLLRGIQAIGGLGAGLALGAVGGRVRPARLLGLGMLSFGALDLAIWNAPHLTTGAPLYVLLFAVVGAPGIVSVAGLTAFVQEATDDPLLGRAFAALGMAFNGFQAVGMLLAGVLSGPAGLLPVLNAQGLLCVAAGLVSLRFVPERGREGHAQPKEAVAPTR